MPTLYLVLIKNSNNDPQKNKENTIDVQWEIKIRIRQKKRKKQTELKSKNVNTVRTFSSNTNCIFPPQGPFFQLLFSFYSNVKVKMKLSAIPLRHTHTQ